MLQGYDEFELAPVIHAIRTYEGVSGLSAQHVGRDSGGLHVYWVYEDGTWAGTTCYEMPLDRAIEKLERQIESAGVEQRAVA